MADRTYRGTTEDREWPAGDLTGGNDSGTAGKRSRLDEAQGPDRTAQILEGEGGSAAGFPGPDPSVELPLETEMETEGRPVAHEPGAEASEVATRKSHYVSDR